jgi:Fic family protein
MEGKMRLAYRLVRLLYSSDVDHEEFMAILAETNISRNQYNLALIQYVERGCHFTGFCNKGQENLYRRAVELAPHGTHHDAIMDFEWFRIMGSKYRPFGE